MRIDGPPPPVTAVTAVALLQAVLGKRNAPSFPADPAPPPAAPAAGLGQPATSVQMLVALASIDPAVERRRKLAAETDRGLAMLERLHQAMAAGEVAPDQFAALATWADGFAIPDDPDLAPLARDVELRVRVELAKHDMQA